MKLDRILAGESKHALTLKYTFRPSMEETVGWQAMGVGFPFWPSEKPYLENKQEVHGFGRIKNTVHNFILEKRGVIKSYNYNVMEKIYHDDEKNKGSKPKSYPEYMKYSEEERKRLYCESKKIGELTIFIKNRTKTEKDSFRISDNQVGNEEAEILLTLKKHRESFNNEIIKDLIETILSIENIYRRWRETPGNIHVIDGIRKQYVGEMTIRRTGNDYFNLRRFLEIFYNQ